MDTIIISDIFGNSTSLQAFSEAIGAAKIISPYKDSSLSFDDEATAYQYFVEHVGLDRYFDTLKKQLEPNTAYRLIGFSVGASVLWRYAGSNNINKNSKAFAFYGSQIRHYLTQQPKFSIDVILPKQEDHFDISYLANKIALFNKVSICQSNYYHGFMNKLSRNYNEEAYFSYLNVLKKQLL
ncbi:hypothetical protein [Thalassotalea sp. PLHSN55]|uniref:hypothetical protein n=1 Tax=Thalassotalea sp. PLHSN55 TaxID=3435888 RepID=UPI003F879C0A